MFMNRKEKLLIIVYCFLSSFAVLMMCTKSSFMYPFQDGMDANCFFTVGKSLARGKVLYRDIYEHKGLILYLIYSLAYLISNDTFIGVFFIEIISGAFFLFYSYKIINLLLDKNELDFKILLFMPILAFVSYTGECFSYGGQIEELVLPILAWTLYKYLYFVKVEMPQNRDINPKTVFLMGFYSAILFWMKYTLTGMILSLVIFVIIVKCIDKQFYSLFKNAGIFLLGFISITIPVIIYFAVNDALKDLWHVYFYNLIFAYNERDIGMSRIEYSVRKILLTLWRNRRFTILAVMGVIGYTIDRKSVLNKRAKWGMWLVGIITTFSIFYSRQYNRYWGMVFAIFTPLGIAYLLHIYEKIKTKRNVKVDLNNHKFIGVAVALVVLVICSLLSKVISYNTYLMKYTKEEMPQFIFANVIKEDGVENPKIINYGCLDLGLYTATNTIPECKYFCDYNLWLPEIHDSEEQYVTSGQADYIVMREELNFANDIYEEASVVYFEMEFHDMIRGYRLYRNKNINKNINKNE